MASKSARIADVDRIFQEGTQARVIFNCLDDESLDGRRITIDGRAMLNFGSCSYLGLETDHRLMNGAISAISRYGTQFSSSRAYVSIRLYDEAETLLSQIFNAPTLLYPTTTLAHISVIPVLVGEDDAVLLDQRVHNSVVNACQLLSSQGTFVGRVRHNDLERLEQAIRRLSGRHRRVWYMADGVYSMHGDVAPLGALCKLMDRHEQLFLYVDDAHGMSWTGKRGCGYALSELRLSERVYVASSLAKGFGTGGGVLALPDEATRDRVRRCGSVLTFSGPLQPGTLGAIVASGSIHNSDEIYVLQNRLSARIRRFWQTAQKSGLPVVNQTETPIFFIGVGEIPLGIALVRRLMDRGFFVNISAYPSVPLGYAGVRVNITNQHEISDIDDLICTLKEELCVLLDREGLSLADLRVRFGL
jgi:7-keto-8-aminopelargonate synthetase-like enzyme